MKKVMGETGFFSCPAFQTNVALLLKSRATRKLTSSTDGNIINQFSKNVPWGATLNM